MCIPVLVEVVNAISSPFTTWNRAEYATREMIHLIVTVQFLLALVGPPTCTANECLLLEGKESVCMCQNTSRRFL
jgi:hypothetical protein